MLLACRRRPFGRSGNVLTHVSVVGAVATIEPGRKQRHHLEVGAVQMIRASAAACVDFSRGSVNQVAIGIEGSEQTELVEPHSGLHAFQSILGDEKHSFPCAVMAPELHGTPWSVIETSLIRETQRHCQRPFELATSPAVSFARIESTVEVQDASINALIG